jgi:hypothetical protein
MIIFLGLVIIIIKCCAVVRGSVMVIIAVPLIETTTSATAAMALVFGLSVVVQGLFSSLHSCFFTRASIFNRKCQNQDLQDLRIYRI